MRLKNIINFTAILCILLLIALPVFDFQMDTILYKTIMFINISLIVFTSAKRLR